MNLNLRRQSQLELFPGSSQEVTGTSKSASLFKDLTLSAENIIVLAIGLLMILVLFFSFGVEKGKRSNVVAPVLKTASVLSTTSVPAINLNSMNSSSTKLLVNSGQVVPNVKNGGSGVALGKPSAVTSQSFVGVPANKSSLAEEAILTTGFTLQIATFKSERWAQKEAANLQKKGFQTFTMQKGNFVILCAGRYQNKEDARKMANTLKMKYKDILVRRF